MYTGNTHEIDRKKESTSVYPCVYREHSYSIKESRWIHGLSLCIQGTHLSPTSSAYKKRFIPVYTGNTSSFNLKCSHNSVYPCVYREHTFLILLSYRVPGLSLCIQGTLKCLFHQRLSHRFIPVYTGNTSYFFMKLNSIAVYPCVYREHKILRFNF